MRQTKKELFEIIRQQSEVIEYWMEKALEQSDLKVIDKEGSIAENEQQHHCDMSNYWNWYNEKV